MISFIIGSITFVVYLYFQAHGISAGDSGDLVTAAINMGIPHPPGYPLYTLLGWMASLIPIYSPAWRVTLISSLSHAAVIGCMYYFVYLLTKRHLAALFSAVLLAGNYVFFLYSVVPEVFGLLDVFMIVLILCGYFWTKRPTSRLFSVILFIVCLSLTHHHFILFIFPAFLYLLISDSKNVQKFVRINIRTIGVSIFGLAPYFYIIPAAYGKSIINWDRPVTIDRITQLITRADYGTFVSGASVDMGFGQRLISLHVFLTYLIMDFTWVGAVLAIVGMVWMVKHHRRFGLFCIISFLCFGPVFSVYANFPLHGRFALGTYERFLLPSYVLYVLSMGLGLHTLGVWIEALKHRSSLFRTYAGALIVGVFMLLPIMFGSMTIWRFWGFQTDMSAENLGVDILQSAPLNAMVLLSHDTPLFISQYVRYGLHIRPDLIVLHVARLKYPDYQEVIKNIYPSVQFPPKDSENFMSDFIRLNREKFIITSNTIIDTDSDWPWLHHGLLYILVNKNSSVTQEKYLSDNEALWNSYHAPQSGILSRYTHLMLSNILDEYTLQAASYGEQLIQMGLYKEANIQLQKAVSYGSDYESEHAYFMLGLSYIQLKQCDEAKEALRVGQTFAKGAPNPLIYKLEGVMYRDCFGDTKRADELFRTYETVKKSFEISLPK